MPISTSIVRFDSRQADGRRLIEEQHLDHVGVPHLTSYLAAATHDTASSLTANAAAWATQLAQEELARNEDALGLRPPTFTHATAGQFRTRLRQQFQAATGLDVGRFATFFLTLTDAQLQALFSVDAAGLIPLKVRLQNRKNAYDAVLAAQGE